MSLLSVTSLTVRAAGRTLVDDLSFDLDAGQRLGLIGESGSGKSVTSLAVTGLLGAGLEPSGSVLLDGVEIVGAKETSIVPLRGRVASVVFQEPLTALDPLMRIERQVAEPLARHRGLRGAALRTAVREALDEVSLDDARIGRAYPHEISGGMAQRVLIAGAVAGQPKLLIADEPTTALDVTVQAEVLDLLRDLQRETGMAVLLVTHNFGVVADICDRVAVMKAGRIVETNEVDTILRSPSDPYTQTLLASMLDEGPVRAYVAPAAKNEGSAR